MNILGIFRGFPGLGRVVAGVSVLETLRDYHNCNIKIISYLQGNIYLQSKGYSDLYEVNSTDFCAIGLLPTGMMGIKIHNTIKSFQPDIVIIDGEPLIIKSLRISYPNLKLVALLNPSDVDNPQNDKEAMDFFSSMFGVADLAIVHGLRIVNLDKRYKKLISIRTILRKEILNIDNKPGNNIYCLLGGGTVNVGEQFFDSSIRIAKLCINMANKMPRYSVKILCSSQNIYNALSACSCTSNVVLYNKIVDPRIYYSDASLVITRAGRNSLSELAYLKIPAISFVSGCIYRKVEQEQNIQHLHVSNVSVVSEDISTEDFYVMCKKKIARSRTPSLNNFEIGNDVAIKSILSIMV